MTSLQQIDGQEVVLLVSIDGQWHEVVGALDYKTSEPYVTVNIGRVIAKCDSIRAASPGRKWAAL